MPLACQRSVIRVIVLCDAVASDGLPFSMTLQQSHCRKKIDSRRRDE